MKEFDELLEVAEKLMGPGGCPWDQKQTFSSLQPYVLEEAHEVIEAVDKQHDHEIIEELGDLLYTILFYGKVAQKEGRFSIIEILNAIREKLIRRHPHVFGEMQAETVDEVIQNWEKIKGTEEHHAARASALDGIPPTLPTLIKAQKIIRKMKRAKYPAFPSTEKRELDANQAGEALLGLILSCEDLDIDLESSLRRALQQWEKAFREWES